MKAQGIQAEGGFTLVEVGMVIAISGLLLAGVIATSAGSQRNSSFTTAIDSLQNTAKEVQNQATATISTRSGNQTGDSPYVIFGKAMIFTPTSPTTYTVATLIGKPGDTTDVLAECDDPAVTLPNGISYQDSVPTAILFQNNPDQIYVASNYVASQSPGGAECTSPGLDVGRGGAAPTGPWRALMARLTSPLSWLLPAAHAAAGNDILDINNYTPGGPFGNSVTLDFADPGDSSQTGMLTVNPSSNTITRGFQH